ncbi:hypothetical protein H0H92_014252, partial [Tricholoma furcatifolium]
QPIVLSDMEEDESIVLSDVEDVNEAVSSATITTSKPTTPAQPLTTTTTTVKSSTAITSAASPTPPTTTSATTLATPPTTTVTLPTPTPVEASTVEKSVGDFEDEAMPSAASSTPPTTTSPATLATPPTTTATLPAPTPVGASIVAKSVPADLASRSVARPRPRQVVPAKTPEGGAEKASAPPDVDLEGLMPMENVGMRKALGYLSKKTWGNGWEKCLEAFVNFEKEKGYP